MVQQPGPAVLDQEFVGDGREPFGKRMVHRRSLRQKTAPAWPRRGDPPCSLSHAHWHAPFGCLLCRPLDHVSGSRLDPRIRTTVDAPPYERVAMGATTRYTRCPPRPHAAGFPLMLNAF